MCWAPSRCAGLAALERVLFGVWLCLAYGVSIHRAICQGPVSASASSWHSWTLWQMHCGPRGP